MLMKRNFNKSDLITRLIWTLVGYFASLYGIVDLPTTLPNL